MSDNYQTVSKLIIQDKYEPPCKPLSWGQKIPGFKYVKIIIDVSGSTIADANCSGRFSRGMIPVRETPDDPTNTKPKTKVIIIAELEGVAHYLLKMMERYDLSGIVVQIYSFSSHVFVCYDAKIKSNEGLYQDVVIRLDDLIIFEGSGTDAYIALKKALSEDDTSIELCIATDGRDENPKVVRKILRTVIGRVRLFVIGAGSISGANSNDSRGCFVRNRQHSINGDVCSRLDDLQSLNSDLSLSQSPSSNSGQCNLGHLQSLAKQMVFGGSYCGAYGDYTDLKAAAEDYFNLEINEYSVVLDQGLGKLSELCQTSLSKGISCFTNTAFGYYIVTPEFQIGVVPEESYKNEFLAGELRHDFKIDFTFDTLYNHNVDYEPSIWIDDNQFKVLLVKHQNGTGIRIRKIISNPIQW